MTLTLTMAVLPLQGQPGDRGEDGLPGKPGLRVWTRPRPHPRPFVSPVVSVGPVGTSAGEQGRRGQQGVGLETGPLKRGSSWDSDTRDTGMAATGGSTCRTEGQGDPCGWRGSPSASGSLPLPLAFAVPPLPPRPLPGGWLSPVGSLRSDQPLLPVAQTPGGLRAGVWGVARRGDRARYTRPLERVPLWV